MGAAILGLRGRSAVVHIAALASKASKFIGMCDESFADISLKYCHIPKLFVVRGGSLGGLGGASLPRSFFAVVAPLVAAVAPRVHQRLFAGSWTNKTVPIQSSFVIVGVLKSYILGLSRVPRRLPNRHPFATFCCRSSLEHSDGRLPGRSIAHVF